MKTTRSFFRMAGRTASFALIALAFAACSKDNPVTPQPVSVDVSAILTNIADNVIVATYSDLETNAAALSIAVHAFTTTPNQANLDAARAAWRETRRPWEMSEGFLFGPVDTKGLDPALDSWPVNTVDLDAVLAGDKELTKDYIDGLEGTLKGFHTIEYLLFGNTGNKDVAAFTAREFSYLQALAQSLHGAATQLVHSWTPQGDNFALNLREAGKEGSIYPSQKAAVQELAQSILGIADEVGNGKINDPFTQRDVTLEESRFSNNSKADFQDNIRSIKHVYTGDYNKAGSGLDDIVRSKNTALDTRIKAETDAAIAAIEAIPGTFTTAITSQRTAVEHAQNAVRTLQETIEQELLPLLNTL